MTLSRALSIWFGAGLLRPAPGTWGSLVALVMGLAIDHVGGAPLLALATVLVCALGFWACARELQDRPDEDPSEIVIDEVAGQWLALLFPSFAFWSKGMVDWPVVAYPGWIAAFLFFRLFDIWKPWLVGRADRRGDSAGVMLDDLWAGLFAGLATIAAGLVYHLVLFAH